MIGFKRSDPAPLYLQVKESLRHAITSGEYVPGAPLPTERELAAKLKLNRMTVRRALTELAKEGFICRIPGRGTFLPGGNLSESTVNEPPLNAEMVIALVAPFDQMPRDGSSFYFRAMQAMEAACAPDISISLRRITGDCAQMATRLKADRNVRGIIAMAIEDRSQIETLAGLRLPLVVFDAVVADTPPTVDAIAHENEEGVLAATRALLELGHRDIACFVHATSNDPATAVTSSIGRERLRGFERAFTSRGLPVRRELIIPVLPSSACGYAAAQQLLRAGGLRPTAFFCTVDELAVGVVAGAKDAGLRVPEQVSVIGYGDLGLFSTPALSTVRMQIEASGRTAMDLVQRRIADPSLNPQTIVLPTELIVRGTTAVPQILG
jgi:DNA-binding LacI/PurR family transcriptional regulator/DNA-binding transcriptional regulator YhcF (GntR family)